MLYFISMSLFVIKSLFGFFHRSYFLTIFEGVFYLKRDAMRDIVTSCR
jgi:hypothetical protein